MKIISTVVLSTALAIGMAGCASSPGSRGTGEVVDDASTTARVKTAIVKSQGIKDAAMINVDTYRGVVSLAGFVGSSQEIQEAVKAARSVEGVSSVKNNLEVRPAK